MRERFVGPLTKQVWEQKMGSWYTPEPTTGCHLWLRADNGRYGRMQFAGRARYSHRVAYELHRGPIADGLTIDHLCRTPLCVNPDHLRAVTLRENLLSGRGFPAINAKKVVCPKGHALVGHNVLCEGRKRKCRTCHNDRRRIERTREG